MPHPRQSHSVGVRLNLFHVLAHNYSTIVKIVLIFHKGEMGCSNVAIVTKMLFGRGNLSDIM
jgi:hypothetical protein